MPSDGTSGWARPDLVGPLLARVTGDDRWGRTSAQLITGGHSNLTFLLSSPAGELILRRPPSGGILATAHDMGRETRVQRALAGTSVPVPRILLEDPGEVLGVPFYVMTKVPGLVLRDVLPESFTEDGRRHLGERLVDVLADLNTLDPEPLGLGGFGRPEGFTARQVRRWRRQIAATPMEPIPALDVLADRLEEKLPRPMPPALVHGDFRLDNCVVDGDRPDRINGVLDWEMSTLGDPLTDLGLLLFYWEAAGTLSAGLVCSVTGRPGFPTAAEVADRYSTRTGFGLDELDWYRAFAYYKFAGIALGVQARVRAGVMGDQAFTELEGLPARLADAGLSLPVL